MGGDVRCGLVVVLGFPHRRASPAHIAMLVRAPLRFAKGVGGSQTRPYQGGGLRPLLDKKVGAGFFGLPLLVPVCLAAGLAACASVSASD